MMKPTTILATLSCGACLCTAWSAAQAQLVFATDRFDGPQYVVDVEFDRRFQLLRPFLYGGAGAWGMAADNALGVVYYSEGEHLYRVLAETLRPEYLGAVRAGIDPASMLGLAWNSDEQVLYGVASYPVSGVYEIELSTLQASLVLEIEPSHNVGALDYDNATQMMLALFDGQGANGGGLYRIDLAEQRYEFVAPYPGQNITDIDGLAAGDGRAYLVTDRRELIFVYDLVEQRYLDPLRSPVQNVNVMCGAAWAPSFMDRLLVSEPVSGRVGRNNQFYIVGARPGSTVHLIAGWAMGATGLPGCSGSVIEIASPRVLKSVTIGADGRGRAGVYIPLLVFGRPLVYQVVDPQGCALSNLSIFEFGPDR